ncbi:DUF4007 family protein [Clostridium butyricum]|uniref:DUF4007 family protein n=1 Tax=Clostridium butyricum TaxID=1492 RepID=UPI0018A8F25F|nr:DUF4007 family protein [Clostridium butyricum]
MNIIQNKSFDFHQTFQPQRIYIANILELAYSNYQGTKEDISKISGIPTGKFSGKVIPHIKYACYMGLINYSLNKSIYTLSATEVGKKVYENDKSLSLNITKLICHYNMCDFKDGAPQWSYLFKVFKTQEISEFKIKTLNEVASHDIQKNVDFAIISKVYSSKQNEDNILNGIGLKEQNKTFYFAKVEYRFEYIYVYAYSLLHIWEEYRADSNQITIGMLINELKWNNIFGISQEDALDIIDELEELGIIKVNKQMDPVLIQRLNSCKNMIDKLYCYAI